MAYELFMDGFDYYATADITKKWQEFNSTVFSITAGAGRRGGGALRIASFPNFNGTLKSFPFTPSSRVVVSFALKVDNTGRGVRVHFYSSGVLQFTIGMNDTHQFFAQRAGVPAHATSVRAFPLDTYQFVELGLHLADAGSYELRVNGSASGWLEPTNYDTLVTPGGRINQVWIERVPVTGAHTYMDDFFTTYGDELKWMGDSRVDTLTLTGNSSPQDWVPDTGNAWERLNQEDGYIASATPGSSSLFSLSNLPHNPQSIHGVQVNAHVSKSDVGFREISTLLKTGALTTAGTPFTLATGTLLARSTYTLNPATGSAFLKPEIDALEAGVRVVT